MSPWMSQADDESIDEGILFPLSSISVSREIPSLIRDFVAELENADRMAQRKRRRKGRLTASAAV
jgi:hypothetical protein